MGVVRVTMLDGGAFTSPAGMWRQGESMERQVRFPVPVYLIEVGEERILVDTGLNPDAAADAASHYGGAESLGSSGSSRRFRSSPRSTSRP
jgi:hypothetical protein